jgi:putative acetyltransferase
MRTCERSIWVQHNSLPSRVVRTPAGRSRGAIRCTGMQTEPSIRATTSADAAHVAALHTQAFTAAFGRSNEAALVARMQADGDVVLSLAALVEGRAVGHALWFRLQITLASATSSAVGLGPIAVHPDHQRRGIGSALIRAGHRQLADAGERLVIVLGHPEYYPRFGFSAAAAAAFQAPWSGPAFMALALSPDAPIAGRVSYPRAFFEA